MTMDSDTLATALSIADAAHDVRDAAAALRVGLAPMRVVVVDGFDMRDERPAAIGTRHALWLGASDGHCWTVTGDAARASGLFIAVRGDPS